EGRTGSLFVDQRHLVPPSKHDRKGRTICSIAVDGSAGVLTAGRMIHGTWKGAMQGSHPLSTLGSCASRAALPTTERSRSKIIIQDLTPIHFRPGSPCL